MTVGGGETRPRRPPERARATLRRPMIGLGYLALVAAATGGGWLAASRSQVVAPPPRLQLTAPESVRAGAPVEVVLEATAVRDGTVATLIAVGSYGTRVYRVPLTAQQARFALSAEDTRQAGQVTLRALVGAASANATMVFEAGPPVEPIVPLIGSRNVRADGAHWALAVMRPHDALGNSVADGTPVRVRRQRPDGRLDDETVEVSHLLAWIRLFSGTVAGRSRVAAQVEGVSGPEAVLNEVPAWPAPFSVTAEPMPLPADWRELTMLRSEVIRDSFGNPMPDGTQVSFVVETAVGHRSIPALTVRGIASAPLQAPYLPGSIRVWGSVYGVESEPLVLEFTAGPAVGRFPVIATVDPADGEITLVAGPLLGALDQYVPDGTPVRFALRGPQEPRVYHANADAGRATLVLRAAQFATGSHIVEVTAGSGQGETVVVIP